MCTQVQLPERIVVYELTGDNHKDMEYRVKVSHPSQSEYDALYILLSS